MATDLAEFLGGAIGLSLLFGMPLMAGMVVTAIVTYGILMFEGRGFRPMELIIGAMVGVIGLCYLVELFIAPVNWGQAATGLVTPSLPDNAALIIAVGIVGATVMPHAIYLHSGLTQNRAQMRNNQDRRKILTFSNREVVITMIPAFVVVAMGVNPTKALVMSQVVLSIALPVPMIALIIFSGRRSVMGEFRIGPLLRTLSIIGATVLLSLNFVLLAQIFGLSITGLP